MSKKHLKLPAELAFQIQMQTLHSATVQALPESLKAAGISLDLVKPYFEKVIQDFVPRVNNLFTKANYDLGLTQFLDETSSIISQLPAGLVNTAVRPVANTNSVPSGYVNTAPPAGNNGSRQQGIPAMPLSPAQLSGDIAPTESIE